MYGRLIKAVYGTLPKAIIFYNKLSKHLIDHGFVQNKHDMCTVNKILDGEQIPVQFNVDDLKVSHKDQAVWKDYLTNLRDEFGQADELTENKGLLQEYLGITIDYSIPHKVIFTIFDYHKNVIVEASDGLKNNRLYYPRNDSFFNFLSCRKIKCKIILAYLARITFTHR